MRKRATLEKIAIIAIKNLIPPQDIKYNKDIKKDKDFMEMKLS